MLYSGPYNPTENEEQVLNFWLENGFYKLEYDPKTNSFLSVEELRNLLQKIPKEQKWCLICPPPNAYSRPHIGNISGYAYQDAMARYARMQGKKALIIPGKDHAGLEGEAVFVRDVLEKQGKKKSDFTREEFYKEIYSFFQQNIQKAQIDEKKIGLSADFDKDTFTLDPDVVEIVLDTFIEMYNKGMIYKGVRLVNWDTKAKTPVADNQTIFEEKINKFYYFKYIYGKPVNEAYELQKKYHTNDPLAVTDLKKLENNSLREKVYLGNLKEDSKVECILFGFSEKDISSFNEANGFAYGVLMRLKDTPLLCIFKNQNEDFKNIFEYQKISFNLFAGGHILKFKDSIDENYYTNGFIIGTVRPETIFGDVAIACNPNDERYLTFVNKEIDVEFLGSTKKLYFIADYSVDKDFGTGLLKVTPAHSIEDWEISQRCKNFYLKPIQVINYDLTLNFLCGEYQGLKISEAREKLEQDMVKHNNLVCVDSEYKNKIRIAERTKAPIEPLLSSQWYLSYDVPINENGKTLRQAAIEMVKNGEVKIHPENMKDKFFHWMENLRDWAISRTLWWGYRLPVWYHGEIKEEINKDGILIEYIKVSGTNDWVPIEYQNRNHIRVQKNSPGDGWLQDESVLDTWFSSGQWIYATLMKYNLHNEFIPTNVLVSGYDILENWDSRMMMFTYFKLQKEPFKDLYLTGLVLGPDGQKMSKSRGNIVDIDKVRSEYGTDALRLVYFYQNSAGANYAITYEKLKTFKQFCNKIWNAARYILQFVDYYESFLLKNKISDNLKNDFVKKIYDHIINVKSLIIKNIENFQFGLATFNLYQEFWHVFCDVIIEESKKHLQKNSQNNTENTDKYLIATIMIHAFKTYLKLMHPFIPFITERLWWEMPKENDDHVTLMYSKI